VAPINSSAERWGSVRCWEIQRVKDRLWDERMGLAEPGWSWSRYLLPASCWGHRAAPALRGERSPATAADLLQTPSRLQSGGYFHSTLGDLSQMQRPCPPAPVPCWSCAPRIHPRRKSPCPGLGSRGEPGVFPPSRHFAVQYSHGNVSEGCLLGNPV